MIDGGIHMSELVKGLGKTVVRQAGIRLPHDRALQRLCSRSVLPPRQMHTTETVP